MVRCLILFFITTDATELTKDLRVSFCRRKFHSSHDEKSLQFACLYEGMVPSTGTTGRILITFYNNAENTRQKSFRASLKHSEVDERQFVNNPMY